MKSLVIMNGEGRLTVPAAIRKALGIEGEAPFEVEVAGDAILLRPAVVVPREDAWAYTPEHRALLAKAREDARSGRVRTRTESDLKELAR